MSFVTLFFKCVLAVVLLVVACLFACAPLWLSMALAEYLFPVPVCYRDKSKKVFFALTFVTSNVILYALEIAAFVKFFT